MIVERFPVFTRRDYSHGAVVLGIGAIHIAGNSSAQQHVIKTCVELDLVVVRAA